MYWIRRFGMFIASENFTNRTIFIDIIGISFESAFFFRSRLFFFSLSVSVVLFWFSLARLLFLSTSRHFSLALLRSLVSVDTYKCKRRTKLYLCMNKKKHNQRIYRVVYTTIVLLKMQHTLLYQFVFWITSATCNLELWFHHRDIWRTFGKSCKKTTLFIFVLIFNWWQSEFVVKWLSNAYRIVGRI